MMVTKKNKITLLKTNISLEIDGWKMKFPIKLVPFPGTC